MLDYDAKGALTNTVAVPMLQDVVSSGPIAPDMTQAYHSNQYLRRKSSPKVIQRYLGQRGWKL